MYLNWFDVDVKQLVNNNEVVKSFFDQGTVVEFIPPPCKTVEKICGTYLILHLKSGHCYVGSNVSLYTRKIQHIFLLRHNCHNNKVFQASFNDDNRLVIFFIPTSDRELAFDIEQNILDLYLKAGLLFNIASDSRLNRKNSIVGDETRQKLSIASTGRVQSSEWVKKRTASLLGRTLSETTVEKIRQKALERGINPRMTLLAKEKTSKPLIANGIKFNCIADASKVFNIASSSVKKRVLSLNPLFKDWYFLPPNQASNV